MTTTLDPIIVNNSQLFRVDVFDIDGATPLTPQSCVCDVWNKDSNTQVVTSENGSVGAGYAQYNWSGDASAGLYEAVLTVTISVGVVKSEHFLVRVNAKPPTITLDPATNLGRLRRMTNEMNAARYSDAELTAVLERFPTVDENGESPRVPSTTVPGEMMANPDWTATYDLHAAAAAVWEEKAAGSATNIDFEADGGSYSDSQTFEQAMRMARFHLARRSPGTISLVPDLARERTYETN